MQPTFRSDLICAREEQQGVVFYKIDDPETKTSFRLYEIEYLIAQKLDGQRDLQQVIESVKAEYDFDISEADLQKFISQLESMGFVRGGAGVPPPPPPPDLTPVRPHNLADMSTQELTPIQPPSVDTSPDLAEVVSSEEPPSEILDAGTAQIDHAELARLLKTAFLHVKQGYLVHARDYFLAAKELAPDDRRLVRLVSSVEVLGDEAPATELERLWKQCREFFPDIADEVGPLMENEATGVAVADAARRSSQAWEEDNRSRVRLTATLVLVVLAGGGGLFYAVRSLHLFEGAVKIRTQTLQGVRLPVYFPSPAVAVQPVQETWLGFGSPGKVSDLPAVGSRVLQGEILAALDLPPKVNAQMKLAHEGVRRAEADYEKVAKILEKVISEHQAAQAERADAEARVKNARPKSLLKQDPAAKKELETWKKALAKANKKLSLITKRERAPRALEAKAKKKVDLAHKKLAALQSKLGTKLLRAPFAGEVTELKAKAGDDIKADDPVIHLRDPIVARLTFSLKGKVGLQPGGEAMVSVQRGNPVAAKVVSVAEAHGAMEVSVDISDPAGTLVGMNADAFRLVQEFADPAFKVRPGAIIKTDDGARLLLVAHGHANRTAVQVLEEAAGDVVVRDLAGGLRSEAVVVVARSDAQAVDTVPEGAAVETEGDGGAKP